MSHYKYFPNHDLGFGGCINCKIEDEELLITQIFSSASHLLNSQNLLWHS
jgi:hypothetical protein